MAHARIQYRRVHAVIRRAAASVMRRRNRFPGWINAAIDYVADHPQGMLGKIAARRMGVPDVREPLAVSTVANRRFRLLIAPMNYSGQGRLWSSALEESSTSIAACNMAVAVPGGFSFPADLVVPVATYHNSRDWQVAQSEALAVFTHVLVEAEEPLLGRLFQRDVGREIEWLSARGVHVAFMCHGTDIRLPSRHRELTEWSPYRDPTMYTARLERLALAHRELIDRSGLPVFVSTPDLLADVPQAKWCPVVVSLARWQLPARVRSAGDPLIVSHVPTSRQIKGSDLIEPTLTSLDNEGIIDYRPAGGVASALMPNVYARTDVVLDQFRLGSYGASACEAMAAGRVVVGHVLPQVREAVRRLTGLDLPVIEATPSTLNNVLRRLARDDSELSESSARGLAYVGAVHDGVLSAHVLREHWLDPTMPGSL